jgi:hypothetical protein
MIDRLGQRYGLLPSEVMSRATTFDMVIMDISLGIENYHRDKDKPGFIPPISEEELLKIKERVGD